MSRAIGISHQAMDVNPVIAILPVLYHKYAMKSTVSAIANQVLAVNTGIDVFPDITVFLLLVVINAIPVQHPDIYADHENPFGFLLQSMRSLFSARSYL